jgi:hypothetical protein
MIIECQATEAFHLHPERHIYTVRIPVFFDTMKRYGMMDLGKDAAKGHVQIGDLPLEIHDLREHTAQLRKPFALLSEGTLEFFKGSLSRYRHSDAGHIVEEEEEVTHAARSASARDETISEPGTPKQRPAALHPTKSPVQGRNVSHKSTLPSVNHNDGLALSTGTSGVSEPTELCRFEMLHP